MLHVNIISHLHSGSLNDYNHETYTNSNDYKDNQHTETSNRVAKGLKNSQVVKGKTH